MERQELRLILQQELQEIHAKINLIKEKVESNDDDWRSNFIRTLNK